MEISSSLSVRESDKRERLLWTLSAATVLIFFQAYMVAPIIPHLAEEFRVGNQIIGLLIPAYMIPYGITSLLFGLVADKVGRKSVMLISLFAMMVLTLLSATAQSATQLIGWRLVTGLSASGTIPQILTLIGELYPYSQRGRPLGWIFGAMAGGMALGSSFGAILLPAVGWQGLFVGVGIVAGVLFYILWKQRRSITSTKSKVPFHLKNLLAGYKELLTSRRGARTYGYVFLNGIFHSGIFTWLGLYLSQRYGFNETQIGMALLGYGIPGIIFGPIIGRVADRWGRNQILPIGFAIAAIAPLVLIANVPPIIATLAATALSLGYDLTQPLLAGIVTNLGSERPGQAMGLNVFTLFIGFGTGGFVFGEILRFGFTPALLVFGSVMVFAAIASILLFRSEKSKSKH
ncbi:MAG: MFS transporter (plasmid) [Microcoleus anatoxicus]|uniref:MFS transporter n=1 Tax=Microcoleus anatoxicus TaxID=2705319 RepID=UPI00366EF00F